MLFFLPENSLGLDVIDTRVKLRS